MWAAGCVCFLGVRSLDFSAYISVDRVRLGTAAFIKPQRLEPFVSDVSDLARLNVVPFPVLSFTLDSLRFF
jgi:hypothetical protein